MTAMLATSLFQNKSQVDDSNHLVHCGIDLQFSIFTRDCYTDNIYHREVFSGKNDVGENNPIHFKYAWVDTCVNIFGSLLDADLINLGLISTHCMGYITAGSFNGRGNHVQQPGSYFATGSLKVEETSAYCTVNHRASASNYQLSNMKRPARDSNRQPQRLEARTLTATPPSPPGLTSEVGGQCVAHSTTQYPPFFGRGRNHYIQGGHEVCIVNHQDNLPVQGRGQNSK